MGVPGAPGSTVSLDLREQQIVDLPFSGCSALNMTGYEYVTYRVQVPVQQIAWLVSVSSQIGDANLCVRRDKAGNEWNNDGFSEVPAGAKDSVALVPNNQQGAPP